MKKILQVSEEIPANAKILLVDIEASCFEGTDYEWNSEVYERVDERIENMAEAVEDLVNKGHEVYAIVDSDNGYDLLEPFEGLPHAIFPFWGIPNESCPDDEYDPAENYHLEPRILDAFDKGDVIVVAGLWRELCVLSVTRLLTHNGFNAILSLDDDICLPFNLTWTLESDGTTLEESCSKAGVTIKYV